MMRTRWKLSGNADDVHQNAASTSCRPKITATIRDEDFYGQRTHKNDVVAVGIRSGSSVAGHQHESINDQHNETRNNKFHKDVKKTTEHRQTLHFAG